MSFESTFGLPPEGEAQAPGRVNLLGEHTDYNQGLVLPMAIPYRTRVLARRAEGLEVYAEAFGERKVRKSLEPEGSWLDYVTGCLWVLAEEGLSLPGLQAWISSEIPMGAGLSSSAALEIAVLRALRSLYGLPLDDRELAFLAQRAESEFVGVRCGIMDQMASALGEEGMALFLDTRDLTSRLLPLPAGHRILIVDSGLPRRLAEAGYNERRRECEEASRRLGVKSLRELSWEDLARIEELPPPLPRRVRHVLSENERVLKGIKALEQGDAQGFGALMVASHRSLKEDYEVSTPELDRLVDRLLAQGALGARLTGAGFGGSVIALVPEERVAKLRRAFEEWPGLRLYEGGKGMSSSRL